MDRGAKSKEEQLSFSTPTSQVMSNAMPTTVGEIMASLLLDLRHAVRLLGRSPWFAALASMILALGIGLNTALFSMVNAVMFRPLPFAEPDRLVEIWGFDATRDGMRVPEPIFHELRARSRTVRSFMVHGPAGATLRTDDGPVHVTGARVSASFNAVLGVAPAVGRSFVADDDRVDSPSVLLVSHDFAQRYLGTDSAAVGRVVQLDSTVYTVVGVMPHGFRDTFNAFRGSPVSVNFWTPRVSPAIRELESTSGYEITARLHDGVTVDEARRELGAIAASVPEERWGPDGRRLGVRAMLQEVVGQSARTLQLASVGVALVLAIICANLSLLMLARSDARQREFATRKALGATTAVLARLALAESALLTVSGGALGVVLAHWFLPTLLSMAPAEIPRIAQSSIDLRVTMVSALLALVTAIAFGLVPAMRLSRASVSEVLGRTSSRIGGGRGAFRGFLVGAQVTGAVLLCILAGLVGRTFLTLNPSDPGFSPTSLVTYLVTLDPRVYRDPVDRGRRFEELTVRVAAAPGVDDAGFAENMPFGSDDLSTLIRPASVPGTEIPGERRAISPNVLDLLGMPLIRGRNLTDQDDRGSPRVAIVNETLARRMGGSVVGARIQVGRAETAPVYDIVGVVRDARSSGETTEIRNEVYVPARQAPPQFAYLIMRSDLDPVSLTQLVQRELRAAAPASPLTPTRVATTLRSDMSRALARPRFLAFLSAAFSVTALVLSALGVFGVVAYTVVQRRHELGIRAALGAGPRSLMTATLGAALIPCGIGIVTGLVLASSLTRFVASALHGVTPLDVPTFAGAAGLLAFACVVAAIIPARAVVSLDPMNALRKD
jgi:putative ABC transport system permease protein